MQTQKPSAIRQNARAPTQIPRQVARAGGGARSPPKRPSPRPRFCPAPQRGRPAAPQSNSPKTFGLLQMPAFESPPPPSLGVHQPPPPPPPLPTTNASIRVSATSNGASRAVNSYSKPNLRPGRHLTPEGRLNHLITYCGGRVGWHRWNGIGGVIVHPTAVAQGASSPTSPRRSESRWFRRVVSLSPRHTATQKR